LVKTGNFRTGAAHEKGGKQSSADPKKQGGSDLLSIIKNRGCQNFGCRLGKGRKKRSQTRSRKGELDQKEPNRNGIKRTTETNFKYGGSRQIHRSGGGRRRGH